MKKRGFALIAAIFFIIIIATIAVTTLSTASMTARDTVNAHTREQALLLAQSATEFAVMAMQAHVYPGSSINVPQLDPATGNPVLDAAGNPVVRIINGNNCLEQINLAYPGYAITVNLYYIDSRLRCSPANDISGATPLTTNPTTGAWFPSHMALVDVTVRSTTGDLPPIVYNRRTLQKP